MEKTSINLDLLLPEIPDERDRCVARIISDLQYKRGIDKIHVIPAGENQKAQLCFHYNPAQISLNEVEQIAEKAGAAMTERYGHLLINTTGVRHPRHARIIEASLKRQKGVQYISVAGTGFIQLEYNKETTTAKHLLQQIRKEGLSIRSVEDFHTHAKKSGKETHQHHDHEAGAHEHQHGGVFGEKTELIFALICGALLGAGFGLSFVNGMPAVIPVGCYVAAYFFGGFYTTREAIEGISKGAFEIDFLMLVAAIGAAALGQWAEGALLLFLFSLGHSLEHYAMEKAKKSIAALASLAPKTALLKTGDTIKEVTIEALKQGDIIVVKPNSKIAADGIVIKGSSSVNQAPITGESIPVDKVPVPDPGIAPGQAGKLEPQYKVFAGSINGSATLEVKVTRIAADSTIARLVKLVNEAQTQKSPTQNFTDKLEKYYVPAVLILVVLLLFAFLVINEPFSASFYRAMAVLVAASPCALAIATPSAVLSGVARAARGGVLIKGGKPLEELGALSAIAFDKTGTLTEGRPTLTGVYPLNGITAEQLLEIVIAVEKLSDHPLAAAIVKGGTERLKRDVAAAANVTAIQGRGIQADHNGSVIHIGNKELFIEKNKQLPDDIKTTAEELEGKGHTTMLVQQDNRYIGMITLMDVARNDAKETLAQLTQSGIRKMIMLTGDNQKVAEAIAKEIGITEAWGNLLPEQKVAAIEKLRTTEKSIAMVGDGVNDAPAMAKSTVGIAMGAAGSDVALETADIALMADKLGNLPFAIGLSRKARGIIRQNLVLSLGMVVILIPLTILGIADIGPAVIGHEGSTLVVVFNALRLLGYKK
ncbi:heavy metal translocating P-type ATPase [Niabella sp.]|uniref:heavy metal translocating P-type ATPase n=1 Tax=Niabella sp. TaxID=1962976 RepID=UPI002619BEBA|nr:heavy metal translocating P-type ATPase [Niabella sp.]